MGKPQYLLKFRKEWLKTETSKIGYLKLIRIPLKPDVSIAKPKLMPSDLIR